MCHLEMIMQFFCLLDAMLPMLLICGAWWLSCRFGALRPEGHRFESHSSRHIGTLGKSFTHSCL